MSRFSTLYTCAVWKLRKFTLTHFWQNFRESNGFTNEITKKLIWQIIFSVRVNFSFFHTATCDAWISWINFDLFAFSFYELFREIELQITMCVVYEWCD